MDEIPHTAGKNKLYAGVVWLLSFLALAVYGVLVRLNTSIPGAEEIIGFLISIEGKYIYLAAFISVFIEGLYFVGNFFPGASLALILVILSQAGGPIVFLITISLVFLGWCLAGVINIYLAKTYRSKIIKREKLDDYDVKDRVWATWFPSFRASYEVAQVAEGGDPLRVFISSLRVRLWASLFVGGLALIIPLFFDVSQITEREGFATLVLVALISLIVGIVNIRSYLRN